MGNSLAIANNLVGAATMLSQKMTGAAAQDNAVEGSRRRSVSFDLKAGTQHEITPYGEVYGFHPSEFEFERHGFVLLLADEEMGSFSREDEDDDFEDEACDEDHEQDEMTQSHLNEDSWVVVA